MDKIIQKFIEYLEYEKGYSKKTIISYEKDLELFNKLMNMLDEIEDVQNVYHNVEL